MAESDGEELDETRRGATLMWGHELGDKFRMFGFS